MGVNDEGISSSSRHLFLPGMSKALGTLSTHFEIQVYKALQTVEFLILNLQN